MQGRRNLSTVGFLIVQADRVGNDLVIGPVSLDMANFKQVSTRVGQRVAEMWPRQSGELQLVHARKGQRLHLYFAVTACGEPTEPPAGTLDLL